MRNRYIFLLSFILFSSCRESNLTDVPFRANMNIQIDGLFDEEDWNRSRTIEITPSNSLHLVQDKYYLFLGISNYEDIGRYVDLYIDNDSIGIINLHASMQLGERLLTDNWNDTIPVWNWGKNTYWTANNVVVIDESEEISFLESVKPYQGHEFKISKNHIGKKIRVRLEIKDFLGKASDIVYPFNSERQRTEDWYLLELK